MSRLEYEIITETGADISDTSSNETDDFPAEKSASEIQSELIEEVLKDTPIEAVAEGALEDEGRETTKPQPLATGSAAVNAAVVLEANCMQPVVPQNAAQDGGVAEAQTAPRIPPEAAEQAPQTDAGKGDGKPPEGPGGSDTTAGEGDEGDDAAEESWVNTSIPTDKGLRAAGIDHWEEILANEDMPPELPSNVMFSPEVAEHYEKAADVLRRDNGMEPTSAEVAAYLNSNEYPWVRATVIGTARRAGTQVELTETFDELPEQRVSVEDYVVGKAVSEELDGTLKAFLDPAQQVILRLRYGLDYERAKPPLKDKVVEEIITTSYSRPLTYDEIGRLLKVSAHNIRWLEQQAIEELTEIGFEGQLGEFVLDPEDTRRWEPAQYRWEAPNPNSPISHLPGGDVPLQDPDDHRPYHHRVEAEARLAADTWVRTGMESLRTTFERSLVPQRRPDYLKEYAATIEPVGYSVNGQYYDAHELPEGTENPDKVYDLDQIRIGELSAIKTNITRELEPLLFTRERVIAGPIRPNVRQAALTILNHRIEAIETYRHGLDFYIRMHTERIARGRSARAIL